MNVTYDYYRIFYHVGKYGSFTKAAEILGNSQPNITRAMNNLEYQLGVTLFVRSKQGVQLTREGEALYIRISLAFEQIHLAEQELEARKNMEAGTIKIGVSDIALHETLLPVLKKFRKQYPKISIQIMNGSTPSAIQYLKEGRVDFALVTTPITGENEFKCEVLKEFREMAVAGSMYEQLMGRKLHIQELESYPLISLSSGTGTRAFYDELFQHYGMQVKVQMSASTSEQILPMVVAGLGIGFVPENMISQEAKNLIPLSFYETIPKRKICLLYDKKRSLAIATETLMDAIRYTK